LGHADRQRVRIFLDVLQGTADSMGDFIYQVNNMNTSCNQKSKIAVPTRESRLFSSICGQKIAMAAARFVEGRVYCRLLVWWHHRADDVTMVIVPMSFPCY
jgi:hypothetical protein